MLSGWSRRQKSRLLAVGTVEPRLALVRRFTDTNAADWAAKLDARDWTGYIADRTGCQSPN